MLLLFVTSSVRRIFSNWCPTVKMLRNGHFRIREKDMEWMEGVLDVVILVHGEFDIQVICESSASPQ